MSPTSVSKARTSINNNVIAPNFDREVSAREAVALRAGLRKRYIQDTLVRINGKIAAANESDWLSSLEDNSSSSPRFGLAESTRDRKIKWTLPDGAVEFSTEKRQFRHKHSNKSRRRRIRRLTDHQKLQLYEHRPDLKPEKGGLLPTDEDLEITHADNAIVSFTDAVTKHAVMFSPRALGSFFGSAFTHIQDYAYGSSDEEDSSDSDSSYSDSDSERSESSYSDQSEDDMKSAKSSKIKSDKNHAEKQRSIAGGDLALDTTPRISQHHLSNEFSPISRLQHSGQLFTFNPRVSPSNDQVHSIADGGFHYSQSSPASNRRATSSRYDMSVEKTARRRAQGETQEYIMDDELGDLSRQPQHFSSSSTSAYSSQESHSPRKSRDKSSKKNRRKRSSTTIGEMVSKLVSERESSKGSSSLDKLPPDSDFQRESAEVLMDLVASETSNASVVETADSFTVVKEVSTALQESTGKSKRLVAPRRSGTRRAPSLTEVIKTMVDSGGILHYHEEQEMTNEEILDSLEKALDHNTSSTAAVRPPTPRRSSRESMLQTNRLHVVTSPELLPSNDGAISDGLSDATGRLSPSVPGRTLSQKLNLQQLVLLQSSATLADVNASINCQPGTPSYQMDLLATEYQKMTLTPNDPSLSLSYRRFIHEFFGDNDENHQSPTNIQISTTETSKASSYASELNRPPLEARRAKAADEFKKKLMSNNNSRVFNSS